MAILFATLLPMAAALQSRAQGEVDVSARQAMSRADVDLSEALSPADVGGGSAQLAHAPDGGASAADPASAPVTVSNTGPRWQGPLALVDGPGVEEGGPLGQLAGRFRVDSPRIVGFLQP